MIDNKKGKIKIVSGKGVKKYHTKSLEGNKVDIWKNKKEMFEVVSETIEKSKTIKKMETDIKEIKKLLTEQKHQEEIKRNIRNTSFVFKK